LQKRRIFRKSFSYSLFTKDPPILASNLLITHTFEYFDKMYRKIINCKKNRWLYVGKFKPRDIYMRLLIFSTLLCLGKLLAHERVIFHHIPKTGGMTIQKIINSYYPKEKICPDARYFQIDKRTDIEKFTLFRGHFFYSQLKFLPGKRITFLRDPIQLVLSASRYKEQVFAHKPRLFSKFHFFPPGDPLETLTNHQCHFLSSFDPRNKKIPDRQHLESAKQNLNNFFFVGITEDMDAGAPILCKMLGYPAPETVPHINQTHSPKKEYSQKLLRKIRKRNWADIELYNYAKKLYIEKFKKTNQETR